MKTGQFPLVGKQLEVTPRGNSVWRQPLRCILFLQRHPFAISDKPLSEIAVTKQCLFSELILKLKSLYDARPFKRSLDYCDYTVELQYLKRDRYLLINRFSIIFLIDDNE